MQLTIKRHNISQQITNFSSCKATKGTVSTFSRSAAQEMESSEQEVLIPVSEQDSLGTRCQSPIMNLPSKLMRVSFSCLLVLIFSTRLLSLSFLFIPRSLIGTPAVSSRESTFSSFAVSCDCSLLGQQSPIRAVALSGKKVEC